MPGQVPVVLPCEQLECIATTELGGRFNIAAAQGLAHVIEFVGVLQGQAGGPTVLRLDQVNFDLRQELDRKSVV